MRLVGEYDAPFFLFIYLVYTVCDSLSQRTYSTIIVIVLLSPAQSHTELHICLSKDKEALWS